MIIASMHTRRYQTVVANDMNAIVVDTNKYGCGGQTGFKPQELLEAALAACANLTLRVVAEKQGIPVAGLTTTVALDSSNPGVTQFAVKIAMEGDMDDARRQQLLKSVRLCPVSKIFASPISVVYSAPD
jgi:putative redox protein